MVALRNSEERAPLSRPPVTLYLIDLGRLRGRTEDAPRSPCTSRGCLRLDLIALRPGRRAFPRRRPSPLTLHDGPAARQDDQESSQSCPPPPSRGEVSKVMTLGRTTRVDRRANGRNQRENRTLCLIFAAVDRARRRRCRSCPPPGTPPWHRGAWRAMWSSCLRNLLELSPRGMQSTPQYATGNREENSPEDTRASRSNDPCDNTRDCGYDRYEWHVNVSSFVMA